MVLAEGDGSGNSGVPVRLSAGAPKAVAGEADGGGLVGSCVIVVAFTSGVGCWEGGSVPLSETQAGDGGHRSQELGYFG